MNDEDATDFGEVEELTFEVVKPLGGVVSVRFNGQEMQQLREEVRRSGATVSALIKQATLAHIARMNYVRDMGIAFQSPLPAELWTVWGTGLVSHELSIKHPPEVTFSEAPEGWEHFSTSVSAPLEPRESLPR